MKYTQTRKRVKKARTKFCCFILKSKLAEPTSSGEVFVFLEFEFPAYFKILKFLNAHVAPHLFRNLNPTIGYANPLVSSE